MIKFLDLNKQYQSIKKEIDVAVSDVISQSAFIGGAYVKAFEEKFANYVNSNFCIGVGNGTDALEIAIEALGLPKDSEIIVPANSFIASSEAVTRSGHKVVFCDVKKSNYLPSRDDLEKVVTHKTSAVMAVHLYGHPCDMDMLQEFAEKYDLRIIEDCAQAHGAEFQGQKVGAIGDVGTFSFYPGKNLGAYGDAGAIVTNSEELAARCRKIANHGRLAKYDHSMEGRNSRLDGLQAAILTVKLNYIDSWTNARIKMASYYLDRLADVHGVTLPVRALGAKQVYHLFVIQSEKRDELAQFLKEKNIQTGIHYPIALPDLAAYKYLNTPLNNYRSAHEVSSKLISLPIGEHLTEEEAAEVAAAIVEFYI